MAIYPGAVVRLLNPGYSGYNAMAEYNRVNLHVAAGTGSLYGFFNQPNKASSHFWVSYQGTVEQYVDTARAAEADLDGNDATISIETEGGTGPNADSDPWTPAQIDALVALVRWIMDTHGIPRKLADNSFPNSDSSRGLSWHRLGIDGNFPELPDIRAGRRQRGGGMYYSSSSGKVCPGGGKIQQIPGILDLINGTTVEPIEIEDDRMQLVRIVDDGRIMALGTYQWSQVPTMEDYAALSLVWGPYTDVNIAEGQRLNDQVNRNIADLAHSASVNTSSQGLAYEAHRLALLALIVALAVLVGALVAVRSDSATGVYAAGGVLLGGLVVWVIVRGARYLMGRGATS